MLLRTNLSFQVEKNANPKNLHDMNYSPLNGPNVTFSKTWMSSCQLGCQLRCDKNWPFPPPPPISSKNILSLFKSKHQISTHPLKGFRFIIFKLTFYLMKGKCYLCILLVVLEKKLLVQIEIKLHSKSCYYLYKQWATRRTSRPM